MAFIGRIRRRLAVLFHRDRFVRDLQEEMQSHLDLQAQENQETGMSDRDARHEARQSLGNPTLLQETSREAWGWAWLETCAADLKYAIRVMRKNPGFAVISIATLALGIGANAGIFSVINAALIKPLPFPNPGQLVLLFERDVLQKGGGRNPVSLANFLDWQAHNSTFSAMGVERQNSFNLGGDGARFVPERIQGAICAWSMFPALGVTPLIGRIFSSDEDRHGAPAVVVIAYGLW